MTGIELVTLGSPLCSCRVRGGGLNSEPRNLRLVFSFVSLVVSVAEIEVFTSGSPRGSGVSVARIELGTLGDISRFD